MAISLKRQVAEVAGILERRRAVFPKRVKEGRMSSAEAKRGIETMEAVVATVEKVAWLAEVSEEMVGEESHPQMTQMNADGK